MQTTRLYILIFQISQELHRSFEIAGQFFSVKNVFLASPLSKLSNFIQKSWLLCTSKNFSRIFMLC